MDPKATLNAILDALRDGEMDTAHDLTNDLFEWVARGGFVPTERLGVPASAATPRIEVLAVRDPDSSTDVYVFVDGTDAKFTQEDVDPGAGGDIEDWREHTESVQENAEYSEAFKKAVVEARIAHEDSRYIEGDRREAWTFFGHWQDDRIVIDLVLPGEHQDTREQDDEQWPEGLWCDTGRGADVDEARADALEGYES